MKKFIGYFIPISFWIIGVMSFILSVKDEIPFDERTYWAVCGLILFYCGDRVYKAVKKDESDSDAQNQPTTRINGGEGG